MMREGGIIDEGPVSKKPQLSSLMMLVTSVAFLFAAVYAALIVSCALPLGGGLLPGSRSYGLLAADIVNGGSFSSTYRPPLYPVFLAVVMLMSKEWSAVALWVQAAGAVILGISVVWIVVRISGCVQAGAVAAVLYASHVLFHVEMLSERETLLFSILIVGFLATWVFGTSARPRDVLMGVLTGLLYLTRPTGTLFVPVLCALIVFDRGTVSLRSTARRMMLAMGVVLILVLPWQVFVSHRVGDVRFSASTTSGVNLFKGNNPDLERYFPMVDVDLYEPFIRELSADQGLSGPKGDESLQEIAVQYIVSDPVKALTRAAVKGLLLFSPLPLPLGKGELRRVDGEIVVCNFVWRDRTLLILATIHAVVVFGGLVACLWGGHTSLARRFMIGAALVASLFTVAHAATFPETRFRLPLDVLLIIPAALGYTGLFEARRARIRHGVHSSQEDTFGGSGTRGALWEESGQTTLSREMVPSSGDVIVSHGENS